MIRERIIDYVKNRGIKQIYLSEKTGLTPVAISAIMNQKRDIEVDEYYRICEALGVSLDFFADASFSTGNDKMRQ